MRDLETSSPTSSNNITSEFIQIDQEIPIHNVVTLGFGVAVATGVMAVVGRFVFAYNSKISMMGYLLLVLFVAPFLLTYSERVEATSPSGGLYSLVRRRFGISLSFLVGWLELAGYATIIAILARVIGMYGLTMYEVLIGDVKLNLSLVALGAIFVVILFQVAGFHGSRKLNTILAFSGLAFMVAISIVSVSNMLEVLSGLTASLKTIAPFKLSAQLVSSFWGIVLIFGIRRRTEGKRSLVHVSWVIMLIVIGLGMLVSIAIAPPMDDKGMTHVLTTNNRWAIIYSGEPIYTVLIALFSLWISFMGLGRALWASAVVMSQMTEDGYFPSSFSYRIRRAVFPPLLFVGVLSVVLIFLAPSGTIVGMAAAFLSIATILIHIPDLVRSEPQLSSHRPIRLPFHPLFPALTVVMATLAILNLPFDALKWSGAWLLFGILLLGVYAYSRAIGIRAKTSIISEEERILAGTEGRAEGIQGPKVMAVIRHADSMPAMLHLGSRVARRLGGTLILMQIVEVTDELSEEEQRRRGLELWKHLTERLDSMSMSVDVPVRIMVRVAQDVVLGIINAAEEINPQFLFVAPDFISEDRDQNFEEYNSILQRSPSHVVFLNQLPSRGEFDHIAVFVDQGIQAPITIDLAQMLLAKDGVLEIVHVITPERSEQDAVERDRLLSILKALGVSETDVRITFIRATSLDEAIASIANRADLILLGSNKNFMTRMPSFTGINAQAFRNLTTPVFLVAKEEKLRLGWLSSLWIFLTKPLPRLTLEEKEEAVQNIIAGAEANIDFFILILLSSGIATYGLLQNSGAVIIGAMLVAPLMSPIVAIAMSMIRGDVKHLGTAAQSTAQGVLLAISVGAVLTFFSPIKEPTGEILGRVNPNLLDLSIAFLSGAAGAYAMSRKSIASALPGVSIAVALVPPLAVVGYGFAVADLDIAFGALLLFFTNLVAIVLAASLVFIALDFLTTEKQSWGQIVQGLRVTLAFAVIVMAVLGWVTYSTVTEQHKLSAINQILTQKLYAASFRPLDIKIESKRNGYVIRGTLLSYGQGLSPEDMMTLKRELEQAVGGPVTLDITSIPAVKGTVGFDTAVATTEIISAIREMIQGLPVRELGLTVEPFPDRYHAILTVMEFQPGVITSERVHDLERSLSQKYGKSVEIEVYVIPSEVIDDGSRITPSTPTPTLVPDSTPSS